jgi:hypothetical protein
VSDALHPAAPHHLPGFIAAPGETDVLMIAVGIILLVAIVAVGNFYFKLHSLPERMAHKSKKLQFEIVAVLGLLSLFTHNHLFWIIGLLLALIDLPDFLTPLRNIATSVGKIADAPAADIAVPATASPTVATPVVVEPVTAKPDANGKADPKPDVTQDLKQDLKHDLKQDLANREVPRHA